ncbi:TPA: hypothetical protein IX760_003066 [Enterococcus faecium]|jgi:hypothetical protein|uniref:hypothetical protein n=1 Tax=Enterococcus faecium TaxID=1352 RepID=UPI00085A37E1|nr:hypothetical protein [Enterococcus faecium]AOT78741.1 hypothetical protein EfmE745_01434 [Enterococcus faecium]HAP6041864.1 hypothetical protein [Enterococcus faecium]HAQ3806852.1 hypothetical protein [Enterococcus faecium]HAQ3831983.1 hypothetical protein [Enterococcus faecium]HAQ5338805.1 hypothetical protein [Enterococcus faecium]
MKNIWKYGRTGGEYAGQVLDDMVMTVPFTDVPPLEGIRTDGEPLTIADQMFDPKLNQWIILANALDHNDLNNLKAMYEALEHENDNLKQLNAKLMLNDVAIKQENTALKEKADSLAQINSKTMLASLQNSKDIAEIKKQLNPESEGGE